MQISWQKGSLLDILIICATQRRRYHQEKVTILLEIHILMCEVCTSYVWKGTFQAWNHERTTIAPCDLHENQQNKCVPFSGVKSDYDPIETGHAAESNNQCVHMEKHSSHEVQPPYMQLL